MARFAYGPQISGFAQSTVGCTFIQAGPTGIVRVKRAVARVRDFYAQQNKSFFFALLRAWPTALSDDERLAWLALGGSRGTVDVFGNTVPLNGLGSFIRFNLPLLQAGLPFNHIPPTDFTATDLSSFTITASSYAQTIKLTALTPNILANERLVITCSIGLPPGFTSMKARYRTMARAPGPVSLPIDFSAKWIEYGGILRAGSALLAKLRVLNTDSGFYGPALAAMLAVT